MGIASATSPMAQADGRSTVRSRITKKGAATRIAHLSIEYWWNTAVVSRPEAPTTNAVVPATISANLGRSLGTARRRIRAITTVDAIPLVLAASGWCVVLIAVQLCSLSSE